MHALSKHEYLTRLRTYLTINQELGLRWKDHCDPEIAGYESRLGHV
jgi:hypothetical protein